MSDKKQIVVGIIKNSVGKVLLVKRTYAEIAPDGSVLQWNFPGGEVAPGEDVQAALEREVLEETGYSIRAGFQLSERDHPQFPVHISYFACKLIKDASGQITDAETDEIKWIRAKNLLRYLSTDLDPLVATYLGLD